MVESRTGKARGLPWLRHRRSCVTPTVWVDERLLGPMESDADSHKPDETGGMLIGYWSERGDAVITETIEGGPAAERGRSRFVPDGRWQQERLDEIYIHSGRRFTYLGDWHSHPTGLLRPSHRDRETAKAVAKTREARAPEPLTLIASGTKEGWRWGVFRYRRRRGFDQLVLKPFAP